MAERGDGLHCIVLEWEGISGHLDTFRQGFFYLCCTIRVDHAVLK